MILWSQIKHHQKAKDSLRRTREICDICGEYLDHDNPRGANGRVALDHCHATGIVRGVLCHRCNYLVGTIEKNEHLLDAAVDYILESPGFKDEEREDALSQKWGRKDREDFEHGHSAYRHRGCRCDVCRKAGTDYARSLRKRKALAC